jgi:glycosidase
MPLALLILAALAALKAHAQTPMFDTEGGDAWSFVQPISGHFDPRRCDSIAIESGTVRIEALRIENRFHADVPLLPGGNELRAVCRSETHEIARSPAQRWRTMLADLPKAWIRVSTERTSIHLDGGRSERATSLPAPIVRFEWRARAGNPAPLRTVDDKPLGDAPLTTKRLQLNSPTVDGEYYLTLRVTDALGRHDESTGVFRVRSQRAEAVTLASENPAWVDSAVLYGAAPYMFEPQGLRGIEQRLSDIAKLGATAVWISPVTAAAPDDFGYSVVDQFSIRQDFGGAAALRSLVDAAHRLGMRVLVDFVPNHFSQSHAYFRDAQEKGPRSPYYDWFDRDASGAVTQYFDWQHLKNLNFDNPAVRNHILAAAVRFVREFEVDGFRVDASWAVAQRAPEFWPMLRAELTRIDPDIVLIAEASAREGYHVANGFDAAYDWTDTLGQWAWHDVFGPDGKVDVPRLRAALTNDGRGYPPDSLIVRFLNNNDTGERFISRFGPDLARLGATLLFTLPGIPLIYNGDEVGAEFKPYDEGPPIQWNESPLTDHYRQLAAMRRELPALRTRELMMLATNRDATTLAFLRPGPEGAKDVTVLINFSGAPAAVKGVNDASRAQFTRLSRAVDALTGERIRVRNGTVEVPARAALVLYSERERTRRSRSHFQADAAH